MENEIIYGGGGIWIFEQLYVAKMIDTENFEQFVDFFRKYQSDLAEHGEPNAMDYIDNFDGIVQELRYL